ncbi:MAG: putative cytokinetic ring protein SteA, partial [Tumebacillaceae bacterium]
MRFAIERRTGNNVRVQGIARVDRRTKNLVKRLLPGEIAVIRHVDLDEVAADSLIETKVRAVINTAHSISGRYPNVGQLRLLRAGIVLIDRVSPDLLTQVQEGMTVCIENGRISINDKVIGTGVVLDEQTVLKQMAQSLLNV